ncbi:hypothetical protein [Streptomyces sp. MBT62]|uniref:hypothetical protein n=1 Tax=Streptomyces sp. MBT62 TaxID=2800410 RepID=UPI0027DC81F6|nr:hypothetical protein [Streptomyces sp. MBT62]
MLRSRFLASEYGTGPVHGGRIDWLAVDENGAPVIVEHRRPIDLVRYRLFGSDLLGLEIVASVSGDMGMVRRARRSWSWRMRSTRRCSGSVTV